MHTAVSLAATIVGCGLVVFTLPAAHAGVENCDNPTIVGTSGPDTLVGTAGPDVIAGLAGQDVLRGMGGDDILCGGSGSDVLVGGSGDDVLRGDQDHLVTGGRASHLDGDTLVGGPGADVLLGGRDTREADIRHFDTLDFSSASRGVDVDLAAGTASGQGHDTIGRDEWRVAGTPYDDRISGSRLDDYFDSGRGDDVLEGRGGHDWLLPDLPVGSGDFGHDVVRGGAGRDHIEAVGGPDIVYGGPGADGVFDWGRGFRDRLYGGRGDDTVQQVISARRGEYADGGPGHDSLYNQPNGLPHAQMTCRRFEDLELAGPYC